MSNGSRDSGVKPGKKKGENVHFGCKRSIEAEAKGIKILTNKMKVSNRSQYFK